MHDIEIESLNISTEDFSRQLVRLDRILVLGSNDGLIGHGRHQLLSI